MLQTNTTPVGVAFVKVWVKEKEIPYPIERFSYTYSEDGNDLCLITLNTKDPDALDDEIFHDNTRWVVNWGFINGQSVKRVVFVRNPKWNLSKAGRSVVVELTEQAQTLKQDKSQAMYGSFEEPADIVKIAVQICHEHGLNLVIKGSPEDTTKFPSTTPPPSTISPKDTTMAKWLVLPYSGATPWKGETIDSLANTPKPSEGGYKETFINLSETSGVNTDVSNKYGVKLVTDPAFEDFKKEATNALTNGGLMPLRQYVGKVGANKTHSQILDEMGEDDGLSIETRDEELIIKRRNFNKPPLRAYHYSKDSEFLDFSPETKHRSKAGAALNMLYSCWDASTKEFTQGMTDLTNILRKPLTILSEYLPKSGFIPSQSIMGIVKSEQDANLLVLKNRYNTLIHKAGGASQAELDKLEIEIALAENPHNNPEAIKRAYEIAAQKIMDPETPEETHIGDIVLHSNTPPGTKYQNGAVVDKTGVATKNARAITVRELREEYTNTIQTLCNQLHDPTARNDADAYKKAVNALEQGTLQMNPATALFWGDVNHETGVILSILGAGKRYSGNYYVVKSTHSLEHSGGYTVSNEMCTQGSNVKMVNNQKAINDANRLINREIGRLRDNQVRRTIHNEKNLDR